MTVRSGRLRCVGQILGEDQLISVLRGWLPDRRWFAGKGHRVTQVRIAARTPVCEGGEHIVLAVEIDGRSWQVYQVPILVAGESGPGAIAQIEGLWVHDGLAREEIVTGLVGASGGAVLNPAGTGERPVAQWRRGPAGSGPCRILNVEQSNTSVVLGDGVLVKFFRLLSPGINPDIEIHAGLAEVGCLDVGELLGWINGGWTDPASGQVVFGHLAMIQEFFPGSIDGWDLARERVGAGEDFAQESFELGATTARVHRDLAEAFGVTMLEDAALPAMSRRLHTRLSAAGELVSAVYGLEPGLHVHLDRVADLPTLTVQRVHGDFHLGQALRTPQGWKILDFEGEPGGELDSRRVLDHPMRDVAGMLRSYAYASWQGGGNSEAARAWEQECRAAFLDGYAQAGGIDPADHEVLLTAYTIDKAAYEAVYEQRNRPDWIEIPLTALRVIAAD